jgi:hypothetical protein
MAFLYHIYKWHIVLYSIEFNIKEIQSVYTAYTILSQLSLFWPFKCISEATLFMWMRSSREV